MKYSTEIEIKAPRQEVVQKLQDPENLKYWQRGLISYENISGTPGEEGSKSYAKYQMGKREIDMTGQITRKNLPQELHYTFDAEKVHNIQENFFTETPDGHTRWLSNNEFRFSGFMKLVGFFMPGSFRKQTLRYMEDFKNFAENDTRVA
ncbi:MAG: SRPBCC family protein [Salegentibacter sp.]